MTTRRGFLKKGLTGAALLVAAGAVPVALRRTRLREGARSLQFFSPAEYAIFAAVADRILAVPEAAAQEASRPPGSPATEANSGAAPALSAAQRESLRTAPSAAQLDVAGKADAFLAPLPPGDAKELKQLLALFDNALFSLLTLGPATPFTQQTPAQQDEHLRAWAHSRLAVRRTGYQALKRLCCAMYFSTPAAYASADYPGPPDVSAVRGALDAAERSAAAAGAHGPQSSPAGAPGAQSSPAGAPAAQTSPAKAPGAQTSPAKAPGAQAPQTSPAKAPGAQEAR